MAAAPVASGATLAYIATGSDGICGFMAAINFRAATFVASAGGLGQCPPDEGCEVAFAGRSNAGKSSLLNALAGTSSLARTSKTPGRTQRINFFAVDGAGMRRLVDLPGYGYARASRAAQAAWQRGMEEYLGGRNSLAALVLAMDVRHPLRPSDCRMLEWAADAGLRVQAVLTKADKLSRDAARRAGAGLAGRLGDGPPPLVLSARSGAGMDALAGRLAQWLEPRPP